MSEFLAVILVFCLIAFVFILGWWGGETSERQKQRHREMFKGTRFEDKHQ